MGVRVVEGGPLLFAKFPRRGNLTSGCILRRPFYCHLSAAKAEALFPVHAVWPSIFRRVASGQPLFSRVNRRNFNRVLKAALAKSDAPEADRYISRAFRRGASQELKETGSPRHVVASSGI